jgi:hypothetical protein
MNTRLRTTRRWTLGIAAAAALAVVSSAGAGPMTTLAVNPTQLILVGVSKGAYTVRNPTGKPVSLKASIGDYTIKPNGRVVVNPKVPPKGSAKHWLTISPQSFKLQPHTNAVLDVNSHPGKHAGPGDHHALVLFTTAPTGKGKVLVRTRIGVTALVRVPGKIKRKLVIGRPSAVRKKHQLRFALLNKGNINERLLKGAVKVALKKGRRVVQRLTAPARDILPRSRTGYGLPYRHRLKGKLTAVVTVRPLNGRAAGAFAPPLKPVKKTFRVRF